MTAPDRSADGPAADRVAARERALALLAAFSARTLPRLLHRLATRGRFDPRLHPDILDDLNQELALDCLESAEEILALDADDRSLRWLRMAERRHYELRVRPCRRAVALDATTPAAQPTTPGPLELVLSAADRELLDHVADHAELLRNGRFCVQTTAREAGVGRERLRRLWSDVAASLGLDHEHLEFWRRRLAEALCMVAAARLRERGAVRLWDDHARRSFDAVAFRHRLERIRAALLARPVDPTVRRALLAAAARDKQVDALEPRELLELAESIAAREPCVLLWRFEVEVGPGGDLREAARCVWEVRAIEPDHTRVVLARARLLEARGRPHAARALLARAARRQRTPDPRLVASLQALDAGTHPRRRFAPSARRALAAAPAARRHGAAS